MVICMQQIAHGTPLSHASLESQVQIAQLSFRCQLTMALHVVVMNVITIYKSDSNLMVTNVSGTNSRAEINMTWLTTTTTTAI